MYDEGQITSALQQRKRVVGYVNVLRTIFAAENETAWLDGVNVEPEGESDFVLTGLFGSIKAEYTFGKVSVDGVVRYGGRYLFKLIGRDDETESEPVFGFSFSNTGYVVGLPGLESLNDIHERDYPAVRKHILGFVIQGWLDSRQLFN